MDGQLFDTGIRSHAVFSDDRIYRYALSRIWGDGDCLNVIGLNPSTADETANDPTIRKCIKFAKAWGFSGLVMTNLFAYRATQRKDMRAYAEPIGPENNHHLDLTAKRCGMVLAAWGEDGLFLNRGRQVLALIEGPIHCLRISEKTRQPYHPLYIPDVTRPFLY